MDKTDMLRQAELGMSILRNCMELARARGDGQSALDFVNQYLGAVFLLRSLELISAEEENQQEEVIWRRYREGGSPEKGA